MTSPTSSTVDEVAERHSVSRQTIYKEMSAGRLRTYKLGKSRRITAEAEAEWIRQREADSQVA